MVAASPDGSLVVVPATQRRGTVFEVATGKLLTRVEHGAEIRTAAFAPDGRSFVTGGDDGFARRWDARSGARLAEYRHGASDPRDRVFAGRTIRRDRRRPGGPDLGRRARHGDPADGHPFSVTGRHSTPAGTPLLTVARNARLYEVGSWRPTQT